jgi:hypothetical protein
LKNAASTLQTKKRKKYNLDLDDEDEDLDLHFLTHRGKKLEDLDDFKDQIQDQSDEDDKPMKDKLED